MCTSNGRIFIALAGMETRNHTHEEYLSIYLVLLFFIRNAAIHLNQSVSAKKTLVNKFSGVEPYNSRLKFICITKFYYKAVIFRRSKPI